MQVLNISDSVHVCDTIYYENMEAGRTYTATATLHMINTDGTTTPVKDKSGNDVQGVKTFVPDVANGSVDVALSEFDVKALCDEDGNYLSKKVVVFEEISTMKDDTSVTVATEKSSEEQAQILTVTGTGTTAADAQNDTHTMNPSGKQTLIDTVRFTNLIAGKTYTLTGTLMNKKTGEEMLDTDGKLITNTIYFTPNEDGSVTVKDVDDNTEPEVATNADAVKAAVLVSGTVELPVTFDASVLAEKVTVMFETVEYRGVEVCFHRDLTDKDQGLEFPTIHTSLMNQLEDGTTSKNVILGKNVTLVDTVSYTNLRKGYTYRLTGVLMNAETGEELLADGKRIVAETIFTPKGEEDQYGCVSGTEKVAFTFDGTTTGLLQYTGEAAPIVCYETLSVYDIQPATGTDATATDATATISDAAKSYVVAEHKDITDKDQTVYVPTGRTEATDEYTGNQTLAEGLTTIIDTVSYDHLIVGKTYTVKGTLMYKSDGSQVTDADGREVTGETTFTAETESGSVDVEIKVDSKLLQGKEQLYSRTATMKMY